MTIAHFDDLRAFVAVARAGSFTKAAARLGVSQSALSHTLRGLEARLGLRLLNRTTRSVAPTAAGERLLESVAPRFEEIEAELAALTELREKPAGTIRITTGEHAATTILWPALAKFLPKYPDIKVELSADRALTDIVAHRFDAGVRLGEQVAQGMIAVRVGPLQRMVVVGTPGYFRKHPAPKHPRDLTRHECINLRLATRGDLYAWEFQKGSRKINVRVDGRLVFNHSPHILDATLAGFGLAFVMEDVAAPYLAKKKLVTALDDWTPPFPGYYLYYPSRRQSSPAFALLVEALRWRGTSVIPLR